MVNSRNFHGFRIYGAILGVMLAGVLSKRTKLYKIFDKSNPNSVHS